MEDLKKCVGDTKFDVKDPEICICIEGSEFCFDEPLGRVNASSFTVYMYIM